MPVPAILDGECWGIPVEIEIVMLAYPREPLEMCVQGRAYSAARYLRACTYLVAGHKCHALAWWNLDHYRGSAQIGVQAPLFTIEFPPMHRSN